MLIKYDREVIALAEKVAKSPTATKEKLNQFLHDYYWREHGNDYPFNRVLDDEAYYYIKELRRGLPNKIKHRKNN